ncbi:MAG TPA: PAS domain S-box protein [Hyphomicrobiaceae bacterium]|nr:PAS domain S-box protein [Hyphomicrobiaceae bacterium]
MSHTKEPNRPVFIEAESLPAPLPRRPRPAPQSLSVLVAGGSEADRRRLMRALTECEYPSRDAADGESLLWRLALQQPDCILLDVDLPDCEVHELLDKLRGADGEFPCAIVVMSHREDAHKAITAIKAGAIDHVTKDEAGRATLASTIAAATAKFELMAESRRTEQRNAHLAAIVAASTDAIVSLGRDGARITSWSPGATQVFGYSEAEAVGRTVDELIIPDHLVDERKRLHHAVGSERRAITVETERRHKSGKLVPVDLNVSPIFGATGQVIGYSVVFRNISERRKAEAALAARDALLRSITESTGVGFYMLGLDWRYTYANRAYLESMGLEARDITGRLVSEVIGEQRFAEVRLWHERGLAGENVMFEREGSVPGATRPSFQYRLVAIHPHRGADGQVIGIIGVVVDISERKQREQEINALMRELEERAEVLTHAEQAAGIGVWDVDVETGMARYTPQFFRLMGLPPTDEPIPLDRIRALRHPDDQARVLAGFQDCIARGVDVYDSEYRIIRPDGRVRWIFGRGRIERDATGKPVRYRGIDIDITEQKRAQERQRLLMRELAHRGKNLLAVIGSIARRTLSGDRTLEEARTAFAGRLQALANTYSSLTDEAFEGALLSTIVGSELGSFGARAQISGPEIMLTAKVAQTFALVIHELATNASKYGALSVPAGMLSVAWSLNGSTGDRRLRFSWRESGGPPAGVPAHSGFGSTLISMIAGSEFCCEPEIRYEATGFRYAFEAPLAILGAPVEEKPALERLRSEPLRAIYRQWKECGIAISSFFAGDRSKSTTVDEMIIARVETDGTLSLETGSAGSRRVSESDRADLESLQELMLRCIRTGAPACDQLVLDAEDGDEIAFERLALPFFEDGDRISRILVCGHYAESPRRGADGSLAR